MFKGLMTGVSGIRGVIGEGMTPEVASLWSGGFGSWLKGGKVVLSRDSRPTGEMISYAIKSSLMAAGCDVDDIGITTTPIGAMSVKQRGAAGGIIITASHNPQQWNALKFVRADGRMLTAQDFIELERIVHDGPLRSVSWDRLGTLFEWNDSGAMYLNAITGIDFIDIERIKSKKIKVAIDCVNGGGSTIYPELLRLLGCEVTAIHCNPTGIFPRVAEPLPENLGDLCKTVVEQHCKIGFAVDPDGDRLAVVDETGTPIGEELTLCVAVKAVLEQKPGPVAVNCLTSQIIDDIANEFGVECHRTKVGEANVAARILESEAVIGGEGNGGIILPQIHCVRDAGIGMAIFLNKLASGKKTVGQLRKDLPTYVMMKASYPVGNSDPISVMNEIATLYPHDQVSRIDGVRVTYSDGWVQARPSNTEPILRIYSEARSEKKAKEIQAEMIEHIKKISE